MSDRTLFQGKCLKSSEGYLYMDPYYDGLFPDPVKKRLQQARYNLCAACVWEITVARAPKLLPSIQDFLYTIEEMERQLDREFVVSKAAQTA